MERSLAYSGGGVAYAPEVWPSRGSIYVVPSGNRALINQIKLHHMHDRTFRLERTNHLNATPVSTRRINIRPESPCGQPATPQQNQATRSVSNHPFRHAEPEAPKSSRNQIGC